MIGTGSTVQDYERRTLAQTLKVRDQPHCSSPSSLGRP
jgi:hypothetical protein